MNEKKIIDYSRTYRRLKADPKRCAMYIGLLSVLAVILIWLFVGDLTGLLCEFCKSMLHKCDPSISVGIKSESFKFLGKISFISIATTYPTLKLCLINAGCALLLIFFCAWFPLFKGRPFGIYLIMCGAIHLVNSLWFIFGGKYFPYSISVYSNLYIYQEVGIWIMFFIMTIFITGIVGNRGFADKIITLLAVMIYSIAFGAVRYVVFMYLLYKFSVIYMVLFYFMIGPMFDFLYLVMIYAMFINRMIKIYDSREGRGDWEWS